MGKDPTSILWEKIIDAVEPMSEHDDDTLSSGYWPSVTDLFITLFIITIAILAAVFFLLLPKNNISGPDPVRVAVGKDFIHIIEPINSLRAEIDLEEVKYRNAGQAIEDLKETCAKAVERISELKKDVAIKDPKGLQEEIRLLNEKIKGLEKKIAELEEKLKDLTPIPGIPSVTELQRMIKELERQLRENNVNVVIDESGENFRFDSGSPVIKQKFSKALIENDGKKEAPFPRLASEIIRRQDRVDTLEIIGHTDGVPLSTTGNLDQRLPELLAGELGGSRALSAGSNNDLGLLRALALKREWEEYAEAKAPIADREILKRIKIRCYSAGQTILPIPELKPTPQAFRRNDPSARRIEMRLTRLGTTADHAGSLNDEKAESSNEH